MASSLESVVWMEQILETAHLSALLPAAMDWVDDTGCCASDLTDAIAEELALHLKLKRIPRIRLIETIQQAVQNDSLMDEEPGNPCLETKFEPTEPECKAEQIDSDPDSPPPSPSAATSSATAPPLGALLSPGQTSFDQVQCEEHGKWRNRNKLVMNVDGLFFCSEEHKCKSGKRQRSPAPARSPLPRRKRCRTWTSEDISSRIAGFGRYPAKSHGLHREADGSFSLDAVMGYWGYSAGLSIEKVQAAIQDNLFKHIGRGDPRLRFSVCQGPGDRDPIMIKVAHRSKS
jgi:hypothetical protein